MFVFLSHHLFGFCLDVGAVSLAWSPVACVCVCLCFCSTNQDALTSFTVTDAAAVTTDDDSTPLMSRNLLSPPYNDITNCYDNAPSQRDVTGYHGNPPSQHFLLVGAESTCSGPSCAASVSCPIITVSTNSELADVGESSFFANLPPHSDWLRSSSLLANHDSGLVMLQSLDTGDTSLDRDVFEDVLDETDGTEMLDESLTEDPVRQAGTHVSTAVNLGISL